MHRPSKNYKLILLCFLPFILFLSGCMSAHRNVSHNYNAQKESGFQSTKVNIKIYGTKQKNWKDALSIRPIEKTAIKLFNIPKNLDYYLKQCNKTSGNFYTKDKYDDKLECKYNPKAGHYKVNIYYSGYQFMSNISDSQSINISKQKSGSYHIKVIMANNTQLEHKRYKSGLSLCQSSLSPSKLKDKLDLLFKKFKPDISKQAKLRNYCQHEVKRSLGSNYIEHYYKPHHFDVKTITYTPSGGGLAVEPVPVRIVN